MGNRSDAYLAGFGFGEVLARVGADEQFALRDRLGTTVGWLDGTGAVADLTVRDAYGVRADTAGVVPFGYTGHAEDPTGLVWGRARYLSAGLGVWTSEDPIFREPRTGYSRQSPCTFADPTGGAAQEMGIMTFTSDCAALLVANHAGATATFTIGAAGGAMLQPPQPGTFQGMMDNSFFRDAFVAHQVVTVGWDMKALALCQEGGVTAATPLVRAWVEYSGVIGMAVGFAIF